MKVSSREKLIERISELEGRIEELQKQKKSLRSTLAELLADGGDTKAVLKKISETDTELESLPAAVEILEREIAIIDSKEFNSQVMVFGDRVAKDAAVIKKMGSKAVAKMKEIVSFIDELRAFASSTQSGSNQFPGFYHGEALFHQMFQSFTMGCSNALKNSIEYPGASVDRFLGSWEALCDGEVATFKRFINENIKDVSAE